MCFIARHLLNVYQTNLFGRTTRLKFFRSTSTIMAEDQKTEIALEEVEEKEEVGKSQKRPIDSVTSAEDDKKQEEIVKKPRIKKKKVAMLLSYCGQGYYGMQINREFRTIEGELFEGNLQLKLRIYKII